MWWIEILEKYWNQLRDFIKKYGMLSLVILVVYFALLVAAFFAITLVQQKIRHNGVTHIEYGMYLPPLFRIL
ncbi:MAG: hypothetical protein Q3Y08_08090 [Butyricicoccus sp.]|nr:hypothetical protein [Butyricicoccus sp.]